jgi:hypothetical protein
MYEDLSSEACTTLTIGAAGDGSPGRCQGCLSQCQGQDQRSQERVRLHTPHAGRHCIVRCAVNAATPAASSPHRPSTDHGVGQVRGAGKAMCRCASAHRLSAQCYGMSQPRLKVLWLCWDELRAIAGCALCRRLAAHACGHVAIARQHVRARLCLMHASAPPRSIHKSSGASGHLLVTTGARGLIAEVAVFALPDPCREHYRRLQDDTWCATGSIASALPTMQQICDGWVQLTRVLCAATW